MTSPSNGYPDPATIGDALREIADRIDKVDPAVYIAPPHVAVTVMPAGSRKHGEVEDPDVITAAVDAIGTAVLGKSGELQASISHYKAAGCVNHVHVTVFNAIPSAEESELRRENERLQNELAELRRRHVKATKEDTA